MNIHLYIRILLFIALQLSFLELTAQTELVWSQNIGGSSNDFITNVCSNGNNGAIVLGHSSSINAPFGASNGKFDVFIQEFDFQGTAGWARNQGSSQNELAGQVLFNNDNSILQTAINYNSREDNNNINLNQFDLNGDLEFSNLLEFKGLGFPKEMISSSSDGFFIVGNLDASSARYGGWDVFLYKLSKEGSILWKKYFGGNKFDSVESIVELEDGTLLLTGLTYSKKGFGNTSFGKKDAWAMRLDMNGELIWSKVFGTNGYDEFNAAALDRNGNVVLCGTQGVFDYSNPIPGGIYQDQIWVVSLNDEGQINWENQFGGLGDESVASMIKDGSGNFVILANTKSVDGIASQNKGKQDALVINIDASGELRWSSTYGGEGKDEAMDLFEDKEGGLWIVGQTNSKTGNVGQTKGEIDGWLFKIKGEAPSFSANLGPDLELCLGEEVTINARIPSCDCIYLWSNGSTEAELELTPFEDVSYQITITDANGNQAYDDINLKVNTPPSADLSIVEPRCYGENNGSIEVNIEEGSEALFFNWDNGSEDQNQYGLITGEYNLTITDEIACSATYTVQLDQPEDLAFSVETNTIKCFSDQNGSITFTLIDGQAPYTYIWNTGEETNTISNLPEGFYQVTGSDANGCQIEYSTQLYAPEPLKITENITSIACSDEPSGSIALEPSGGIAPYEYIWSNGSDEPAIFDLSSGLYEVTIIDANACEIYESYEIETSESFEVDAIVNDVTCHGINDGSIFLQSEENANSLIFNWSNDAVESVNQNLGPGAYSVTVSTLAGCEEVLEFEIQEPRAIELTSEIQNLSCFDSKDAAIEIDVYGGTGLLSIYWEDESISPNRDGLEAGIYTVRIVDENDCAMEQQFTIDPIEALEINAEVIQNECLETAAGEIILSISGGTGEITINWSNGDQGLVQNNLDAGSYSVSVTDENNCQTEASFEISQSFQISIEETIEAVSCFEESDGSINVTVIDTEEELTFNWSTGDQEAEIENLEAGLYFLTISNPNDCEKFYEFEINEPEPLGINAEVTDVLCFGDETGALEIFPEGGTEPYELHLIDVENNSISIGNSVTGLVAGNYTIQVVDFNSCLFELNLSINQGEQMLPEFIIEDIICPGDTGRIEAIVNNVSGEIEYEWSNGMTGPVNDNLTGGSYYVSITDESECMLVYQIFIDNPKPFELAHALSPEQCYEENNGEIAIVFSGGTEPYLFEWSNGANGTVLENLAPGSYDLNILDAKNCAFDTSFVIEPAEEIDVQVSIIDPNEGETNGEIEIEIQGQTGPYTISWSNGQEGTRLENLGPGLYTYTIVDIYNCVKTGSLELIELEPLSIRNLLEGIEVFPNPASRTVSLTSSDLSLETEFVIINSLGQRFDFEIVERSYRTVIFSVLNLNAGIYFVEGYTPKGRILEKIIVQRID